MSLNIVEHKKIQLKWKITRPKNKTCIIIKQEKSNREVSFPYFLLFFSAGSYLNKDLPDNQTKYSLVLKDVDWVYVYKNVQKQNRLSWIEKNDSFSKWFSSNNMALIWEKKEIKILCSIFYILLLPCLLDFINRKRHEITKLVAQT